jgi:putative heme-binding domain-containing protein
MRNQLNPWGLAAVCLGALALLLASLVDQRVPTLALAGVGVAAVVLGLALGRRRRVDLVALALGGALSGGVLAVGVCAPGLLNRRWGMDVPVTEPDPNLLRAVARERPDEERELADDEWVDAATEVILQNDMMIEVKAAQVNRLPERRATRVVFVHLLVSQYRPGRAMPELSFGKGKPEPVLTDDSGQSYRFLGHRTKRASTMIRRSIDEWLVFELPPTDAVLNLEIPTAAWGRKGVCRFRIHGVEPEEVLDYKAAVARVRQLVLSPDAPPPDPSLGRVVFGRNCMECHTLFGVGNQVGPNLDKSKRDDLTFLLTSIVNPSAEIAKGYEPWVVTTASGQVLSGLIKDHDADPVMVQTAGKLVPVPKADIEDKKLSSVSIMPNDLLKDLSEHEVRSLIAYLTGKGQVRLLATTDNTTTQFFTGHDLTGWQGATGAWRVVRGDFGGEVIAPKPHAGKPALLTSDMVLADDFHLTLRVRSAAAGGAVLIGGEVGNGPPRAPVRVELLGGSRLAVRTSTGGVTWGDPLAGDSWGKLEIVVTGNRIEVLLGGKHVATVEDADLPARRLIALEGPASAEGELRFANLDLRLLTAKN